MFGSFPDPSSGGNPTSLPFPPESACEGIIKSIAYFKQVQIDIIAIGICNSISFERYDFNNYKTSSKKSSLCVKGEEGTWQVKSTILSNPIFQIFASFTNYYESNNNAHAMQDRFNRRLKQQRSFRTVTLGAREFMANYVGLPRTPINTDIDLEIKCFPRGNIFDDTPLKFSSIQVKNGVVVFDDKYKNGKDYLINDGILQIPS